jgi:segregation and condensation protein B
MLTYDDSCQLCTKQQYLPFIREALDIRRNGNLSNSSIETLAIIAYNQPVTRSYVDTVRGVDSSYAIGSLLERGLIEAKGRLDAPGRPMLYGTTPDFLRCFGLTSIADLPGVSSDEAAEMLAKLNREMADQMPDKNQLSLFDDDAVEGEGDEPTPDATAVAIGETVTTDEE